MIRSKTNDTGEATGTNLTRREEVQMALLPWKGQL